MIGSRRLFLVILTSVLVFPIYGQSYGDRQTELAERLHSLAENAPPELAYIQTSKDIYETGEDLWFKVYLLDAQYLTPSERSKTLYLQLSNEISKTIEWQEKYEIQNGFASGSLNLKTSLSEGNYLLEAYTQNSFFHDSSDFKAVRRIQVKTDIISEMVSLTTTMPSRANSIQFSTFPEGGNLVSGIHSILAFKAVESDGSPVDVAGTLFEDNFSLLEFKSIHAGMGSFGFTPDSGKKYYIRLTQPATDSIFLLPEIFGTGMTLRLVGKEEESLSFKVCQSQGLKQDEIYLRVQSRGVVYGTTAAKLKRELRIKIPLSGLPQGIAEITLFNSSLIPVAERLVYINQDKKLKITAEISKEILSTRGKATLKITVRDENGWPVVANLGVTVFDKLYQDPMYYNNILTYYYLTSELKGRIYDPSFYFDNSNKGRDEALDLLMLTQGWRKYVWSEFNLAKLSNEQQQIVSDGITGGLSFAGGKKKIKKERTFVLAFSPNKDSMNLLIPADSAGGFTISADRLKEWENDYVYMKPFGRYGAEPQYKITDPHKPEYELRIKLTDPFESINHEMAVHKIIYPIPGSFKGKEDLFVLSIDHGVVEIPGVTISGQKKYTIRGKFMGTLDSLTKFDMNRDYVCEFGVLNCPRHNREEFGTTKPIPGQRYFEIIGYGTPIEHVIPVIYQFPHYTEEELLKMNNMSRVKAYYRKLEFYKPNYDKETEGDILPDFRNTLLWEPSVITDEKGEATLSFFCSDINTDFVGRIEGVGGEGLLGTGDFKFTVRKLKLNP
jgi:hypothetical protein